MKGEKRFKKRGVSSDMRDNLPLLDQLQSLNYQDAQKEFRKLTNTTHYAQVFGSKPKAQEDKEILKYKRFTDLQMASVFKPQIAYYIENWVRINDQEEFTSSIF